MNKKTVLTGIAAAILLTGWGVAGDGHGKRPYALSAGVSVEYSDNRDSVETNKTDSTDLSVWFGVDLLIERESCYLLNFGYQPSVRYRTNPSDFQNDADVYHDLHLNGWYKPNRLVRLHMSEALNFTDDPAVDQGGATIRRDASFLLNRATAGVEVDLSRRLRADISGYSMVKRYDDNSYAEIGDEDTVSGTAALGWMLDRTTVVSMYGSYGVFNYPGTGFAEGDRGFGYVEVGASFRKEFSKTLQGRVDMAFKRLDYDAEELGSDQSPCGYATLQVSPSPRLRLSGSAGYVLRDSDVEFFASQRYTDVSLRAEWDALMPKRLTAGLSGGYRMGDYRSDTLLVADRLLVPAVEGRETTTVVGADLTYRLKEWLALSVVAQHENVSSDVSVPFDRNSAGLRTRVDF